MGNYECCNIQKFIVFDRTHKIVKTLFEREPDTFFMLGNKGKIPGVYAEQVEMTNTYYTASLADEEIKNTLPTRTITSKELAQRKAALEQLPHDWADYVLN